MGFNQAYHVQQPHHIHQPNQMHAYRIMHDLSCCIIAPMHQCTIIFKCMFMIFKQSKILISTKEIKTNKTKQEQKNKDLGI